MQSVHKTSDELEIASHFEEAERNFAIKQILKNVSSSDRDIESLLVEDLACDDCGTIIPIARQRAVLRVSKSCDYCVDCQSILEKRNSLYG